MKAYSASTWQQQGSRPVVSRKPIPLKTAPLRNIMAMSWALLTASAMITLSVWAAGLEVNAILGVSTWGMGFVFLGLAVDSHGPVARLQAATGISLSVLALLQYNVSSGFVIVSGTLLAAWLAAVLFKRLCPQEV